MPRKKRDVPLPFKETAGVLTAFLVVMSYVGIGFVHVGIYILFQEQISFPPDWLAAMLSLSSAALGFLIGKNVQGRDTENRQPINDAFAIPPVATEPDNSACPCCGRAYDAQHEGAQS